MMVVTFFRDSNKKLSGFQVSGHAKYDDYGKDIVCAAVSALTTNTVNSIETLTKDKAQVAVNEEEGFLSCRLKTVSVESTLLLESLLLGIQAVYDDYGKFIQIRFEEV